MRLAVVETAPHGGLLHYAVQLADALARRGHDVDLVVCAEHELAGLPGDARRREVLVRPVRDARIPRGRRAYARRRVGVALRLTASWARILRVTRRGAYDAVLITSDVSLVPVTLLATLTTVGRRRPAVALVCHNVQPFERRPGRGLVREGGWRGPLRRLYRRVDVMAVHGEGSRRDFLRIWGTSTPVAVVPHGDERIFAGAPPPPTSEERVLFFGDLRRHKGLDVLRDAFALVAGRRPGARLTVAGTPAPSDLDPSSLVAWSQESRGRVEIRLGYVPVEDVAGLFARARVVVTPYLVGYQSGVVHLAMTMGRAVVTSDVGDLAAAAGDGAVTVPPGDPGALADALERVLADPALAARLGAAGRRRSQSTASWEATAAAFEHALASLPERPPRRRARRRRAARR
jgi:glycosyltransferase involved in cell wall biosynthesis